MSQARILVVEDEALLAADMADNLQNMGFEVAGLAPTGESAVAQARALTPDLVLMDIQLRGSMDGIEAAARIHENPGCAVVFLTAYAEDPMLERATEAEPYGYLVKPIAMRELRATIQMALYKARMEAERERLRRELEQTLKEVEILRGFLPICAWCKKVRDDTGYWESLEKYVSDRLGAEFTHGICPECLAKLEDEPVDDK